MDSYSPTCSRRKKHAVRGQELQGWEDAFFVPVIDICPVIDDGLAKQLSKFFFSLCGGEREPVVWRVKHAYPHPETLELASHLHQPQRDQQVFASGQKEMGREKWSSAISM
jgi:hypothetical protein